MPQLTKEPAGKKPVTKKPSGRSTESEDDEPLRTTGRGWDTVTNKKTLNDELANSPTNVLKRQNFWLADGEEADIQFLDADPYAFDAHSMNFSGDGKNWEYIPCQLEAHRHCTMCEDGSKPIWRGAFRILDFRGKWDKDKRKFLYDKPVEKIWVFNATVAAQIKAKHDKKGKDEFLKTVYTITRTGSGKKNTAYTIELARDDEDNRIPPVKGHKVEMPECEEILVPPTDKQLQAMGYSSGRAASSKSERTSKKKRYDEDNDVDVD